ncbi:unnamed protein product [[Candida] boidinii]|nr:unnamed protein product [[Candida] boidinii]
MNAYALGSNEARELLNELEYLWDQVKDHSNSIIINGSGSGGSNIGSNQQGNNSPPFNDLSMFSNNNTTNNTVPLLDHGINRSQSPALSLYRLASTGSNTNLVRPISRLSMTNVTQQQQRQPTQLPATPSGQTTNHTLTHQQNSQQQSIYKNQNQNQNQHPNQHQNQIVSDYEKYKSRNVSNISTLGYNNPNNISNNNNIDFIKWQSDINITLNRITKELNTLRVIQQHSQSQMTYDSKDFNNNNLRHGDHNSSNSNNDESFIKLMITKLKRSVILNFLNFIKIIKVVIKRITIDSILIISIFIIFNKLLKTDFKSLVLSDSNDLKNIQSSNSNNNNKNNTSNNSFSVVTRFITLLRDKFTYLINQNSILSTIQPKDILPANVIIESGK